MTPSAPSENKETPVPSTVAQGREKEARGLHEEGRPPAVEIQQLFFGKVTKCLSVERLDAYSGDSATPTVTLARYLLNMALCESLYSPLQLCEVALRNRLHQRLTELIGTENWYDKLALTPFASDEVASAVRRIEKNKRPVSAGRVVAELQFGFWTSLFESHYEEPLHIWPRNIKFVFPYLPKSRHNRKELKSILDGIRVLRNRVFHHERIVHWVDLEAKHQSILDVIGWASPEAQHMAIALDRFTQTRTDGLAPWLAKIRQHWPETV